jgi:hypothetical protein
MSKQYVNLNPTAENPPRDEYGQTVKLKASIAETKPGAADTAKAFFFIEPGGKNMDFKYLPKSGRPAAFYQDPKYIVPADVIDKNAVAQAQISIAGGDTFTFKRGKERDKSDSASYGSLEAVVWRKVIVRLGHMKGCTPIDPTTLTKDFDPVFIEVEKDGADHELTHASFVQDENAVLVELAGKYGAPPTQPFCTVPTVFVDRIASPGQLDVHEFYIPEEFERTKIQYVEFDGLTWPMGNEWLVSGEIEARDKDNKVRATWSDLLKHVSPRTSGDGLHFKHPEGGYASSQLKLDAGTLGTAFDDWLKAGEGKLKITAKINILSDVANGFSANDKPLVVVAVRDPWSGADRTKMDRTVVHEFGHAFGLGHKEVPLFDADKGDPAGTEKNGLWYVQKGGQGPHCHTGATDNATSGNWEDGSCVMLGYAATTRKTYCEKCISILKRAPLNKLGLVTINKEEWWNMTNT